jgi:uncharacterized membrane protein YesL
MKLKLPAVLSVIGRSAVDWWDAWLDSVLMTMVWLVAQVSIVLGPPATFGVYYVINSMLSGESLGVRGVITGMRLYFGKAWLWGAINLLSLAIVYVNVIFYQQWDAPVAAFLRPVVVLIAILWYMTQFYALPFFMELKEPNIFTAIRNGFFMMMASPLYSLVLMVVAVILTAVSVGFVLPFFLGLPMFAVILSARAVQDRLVAFGLRKKDLDPREVR